MSSRQIAIETLEYTIDRITEVFGSSRVIELDGDPRAWEWMEICFLNQGPFDHEWTNRDFAVKRICARIVHLKPLAFGRIIEYDVMPASNVVQLEKNGIVLRLRTTDIELNRNPRKRFTIDWMMKIK